METMKNVNHRQDILQALAETAAERVRVADALRPFIDVQREAVRRAESERSSGAPSFRFEAALRAPGVSLICEVKKASPSKGVISESFPYLEIARTYEAHGARCISVLTEPTRFLGSDAVFREIRAAVALPMLRKDFVVSDYQLYEAKLMGADAVLLIVALMDEARLSAYLAICDSLGMSALVEARDEAEIPLALRCGARLIGVNNRNLRDFSVNFDQVVKLRNLVPDSVLFVAESGVRDVADVRTLRAIGADAVLIGEALMRSGNVAETLCAFRDACV